ncbi:MAG: flagellar biosynthesis GTPase FlhF [Candidatus Krumholzibacteriia bacterium]|jgi:flagellar biosynthesis GTPase FlhF
MPAFKSNKHSVEIGPVVVTASTLKEAYQIVRRNHGPDAVILGSRTITRREEKGLGHEKMVEVTVQSSSEPGRHVSRARLQSTSGSAPVPVSRPSHSSNANVCHDIVKEVNRIEELVVAISQEHQRHTTTVLPACDNPLADALIEHGASPKIVSTVLTRFQSETGRIPNDSSDLKTWMTAQIKASNCMWSDFSGCHAFMGEPGSGRTDLVLAAAAKMHQEGRRVLVLSMMPSNKGDVRRLQLAAASEGYDAAVINHERQLGGIDKHAGTYDAVLIDLPSIGCEHMSTEGPAHKWLAENTSFHRHLVVPLDKDPRDLSHLAESARSWSCDWIALSRTDLTHRTAKILDVIDAFHLPISLESRDPLGSGSLSIAQSESLAKLILPNETALSSSATLKTINTDAEAVIW